ncbi:hypothetical protein ACDF64_17405 [Agromyces sp. MMS24-JH15]|uniref:hypothetical protein n=1 Tax=Agromyces sp. MMS24-JH15 TaxID=3243765 RepID=UPI003747C05E
MRHADTAVEPLDEPERQRRRWVAPIVWLTALVVVAGSVTYAVGHANDGQLESQDSSAPTPTDLPAEPASNVPANAFPIELPILSAVSGTVAWRASGGDCRLGTVAAVELTTDAGSTWSPVSVHGAEIHQVLALDAESATTAELLATTGPDCVVRTVRTTTDGASWSESPPRDPPPYVDPQHPDQLVRDGAAVDSPCPVVRQLAESRSTVLVLCSAGDAWFFDFEASTGTTPVGWVRLVTPDVSRSVLVVGGSSTGFALALSGIGCMWIPATASELPYLRSGRTCVPPLDTMPTSLALASAGSHLWIQHDDVTTIVPLASLH